MVKENILSALWIDLRLPKSNPHHKDAYLEIDYMQLHKPWNQAVSDIKKAFAKAPVSNPEGHNGININSSTSSGLTSNLFITMVGPVRL